MEGGMFNIEKGIKIPEKMAGKGACKYPFRDMEVGDSFFIPITGQKETNKKTSSVLASLQKKRTGMVFTTRRVEGGIRVWRVE